MGEWGSGGVRECGSAGASFYFNPIEVVENFCPVALVNSSVTRLKFELKSRKLLSCDVSASAAKEQPEDLSVNP